MSRAWLYTLGLKDLIKRRNDLGNIVNNATEVEKWVVEFSEKLVCLAHLSHLAYITHSRTKELPADHR